jgi:2-octaprenylphenol hydroxylase
MSSPEFDVLVVGGGIAGAALVRALKDTELKLALVEANELDFNGAALAEPEPGVAGFDARVSAITPASRTLLEQFDAWESIEGSRCCPYEHMSVWDAEGTGAIDFHASELDARALGYIVENRVLTAALLQDLDQNPRLSLFSPARLADVQVEESGPRLLLEDGRSLGGRLLVAADGALSRVRELAAFNTREWDYGHHALVATVQTARPHMSAARQRFMPTGPLAFLPLPSQGEQHYCSIVWSAEPPRAEQLLALPDEEFCEQLAAAIEGQLGPIEAVSRRFSFPLRQRHAVDYVQPGLALVGDAAHTIHPLAGQGINLGLQDVAALAAELRGAVARGADPGAIEVLRRRKGENLLMMAAMDGFKHLFGERRLPVRWLRNTGMRLVGRAGPVKHRLMRHAMGVR